jgi:hypothetical protein
MTQVKKVSDNSVEFEGDLDKCRKFIEDRDDLYIHIEGKDVTNKSQMCSTIVLLPDGRKAYKEHPKEPILKIGDVVLDKPRPSIAEQRWLLNWKQRVAESVCDGTPPYATPMVKIKETGVRDGAQLMTQEYEKAMGYTEDQDLVGDDFDRTFDWKAAARYNK